VPCDPNSFVIRDPLHPHYNLHSPTPAEAITRSASCVTGVATARNFWRWTAKKWGRYRPISPSFPVTFPFVMPLIHLLSDQHNLLIGEEIREAKSAVSNSYPLHWLRSGFSLPRGTTRLSFAACFPFVSGATATVSVGNESGVAPDHFSALPASKLRRHAVCNLYAPNNLAAPG